MGPIPLERLSPWLSKESKNAQLDVVCDLCLSFNLDSSWTTWTQHIEFFLIILVESDLSWTWEWCHWKFYLVLFWCICRKSKFDFLCVLYINLKPWWSWTPSWTQSQTLEFWIGWDLHLDWCISSALLMSHSCSSSTPWFLTIIKSLGTNRFWK
jgi:hypothetical protein